MSRPAGAATRGQEASPTAYGGRCSRCDRMVWVLAAEAANWCDARCGRCDGILHVAKDGEESRPKAAGFQCNESLYVDRAREDVVGFEGVSGDD